MAQINVEAGRAAWADDLPVEQMEPRNDWYAQNLAIALAAFVAEDDGEPVGFVVVRESQDGDGAGTGEVDTFYTRPAVWGRGIGRALLDRGVAELREAGFRQATLWTSDFNTRARAIYERHGWRLDGATREKVFVGVTFIELRYRLDL